MEKIVIGIDNVIFILIGIVVLLFFQGYGIMSDLKNLQAQAAKSIENTERAIALLGDLKTKLDAALAADDTAAIQTIADSLGAETDKLAAEVAKDTPAV